MYLQYTQAIPIFQPRFGSRFLFQSQEPSPFFSPRFLFKSKNLHRFLFWFFFRANNFPLVFFPVYFLKSNSCQTIQFLEHIFISLIFPPFWSISLTFQTNPFLVLKTLYQSLFFFVYFRSKNLTSVFSTVYFRSKNLTSVFCRALFRQTKYQPNNSVFNAYRLA